MFSGNREIWVLQTMLLINITGNHLGKRLDHEMSDILHGTMVSVLLPVDQMLITSSHAAIVPFLRTPQQQKEEEILLQTI
jgi:uncharacterized membrane protein